MNYQDDSDRLFDSLTDLTLQQRDVIKHRYKFLLREYRQRVFFHSIIFYIFRLTITVGSLAVPALLSIQTMSGNEQSMYWLTWALSLSVTTANGVLTLFKLDKRFFMLHATMEKLRTEMWQYVQLSGRYSGHHGSHKPTHKNQYVYFCSHLERIRMKHIEEEYIKLTDLADSHHHPVPGKPSEKTANGNIIPSPPDQNTFIITPPSITKKNSFSSIEDDAETVIEIEKTDTETKDVSVSKPEGATMQVGANKLPVLPPSPKM